MNYALLDEKKRMDLRAEHLLGLEAAHFRFLLEEMEEPGANQQRLAALTELERRISNHRAALGLIDHAEGEPPVEAKPEADTDE